MRRDWQWTDHILVILKDRIGDQRGYFGARVIEDQYLNKNVWYHMGYPGDRDGASQPYRQGEITVSGLNTFSGCLNDRRAMIVTDADGQPGQSGGPLWLGPEWDVNGNRYVYGVCSATSDLDTTFSGGSVFGKFIFSLCHLVVLRPTAVDQCPTPSFRPSHSRDLWFHEPCLPKYL